MKSKNEPWYVHAALYFVIFILAIILIQVAIIEPQEVTARENFFKKESRYRMSNLREAQILYQKKHGSYTDNIDSLIHFLKTEQIVVDLMTKVDTITKKIKNPFKDLSNLKFEPKIADSLRFSPKSWKQFAIAVDTSEVADTVIDRTGRVVKINKHTTKGTRYIIECPDGYGKIGDLFSDALKNTASWE